MKAITISVIATMISVAALFGVFVWANPDRPADVPTVQQQQENAITWAQNSAKVAMINAQSNLAVSKVTAEINLSKAEAQAKINKIIQDSVEDKALLKNWNLGSDGVTWQAGTPSSSGSVITFSSSSCCSNCNYIGAVTTCGNKN